MVCVCLCVFFFKQKTAYEMRISDWSSDVCSSDLFLGFAIVDQLDGTPREDAAIALQIGVPCGVADFARQDLGDVDRGRFQRLGQEIGRASCRERVCQYV